MNMMPNQDFAQDNEAIGLDKTQGTNPQLARLMKAWESKQASKAKKAGAFGMMAVSLAACGGSDDDDAPVTPVEPVEPVGQTFLLTTGGDTPANLEASGDSGIAGNVFEAALAAASGSLTGILSLQTLTQDDVLVGTDESDILNAVLNGTGAPAGLFGFASPSITDIEVFNFTAVGLGGGLDLINSTGYGQLWNINSNASLSLVNVGEAAAIGLDGTAGGTTYNVAYTSSAAADIVSQTVIANEVGSSTLSGQFTTLNVTDATLLDNGIVNLDLDVSGGVRMILSGSVANIQNLDIDGSGNLVLSASGNFMNLVTLDATGYNEGLVLDVSGSDDLTDVATGGDADVITINNDVMNGDLSVDLGAGADILQIINNDGSKFGATNINELDFTGGVENTENIAFGELVQTSNPAELDLSGVDGDLDAVWFFKGLDADGDFAVVNSPVADLTLNAQDLLDDSALAQFDVDKLILDDSIVNLTVNADAELDIDGLNAPALETLVLNQVGVNDDGLSLGDIYLDINSDADHDVSALQTISATGTGDVDVDLTANVVDLVENVVVSDMNALTSVSVVAGADAELTMTGYQGLPTEAVAGGFDFTISGQFNDPGIFGQTATNRTVTIDVDGKEPIVLELGNGDTDTQTTADDIAAALNARGDIDTAVVSAVGNGDFTISVIWEEGAQTAGDITGVTFDSDDDLGSIDEVPTLVEFNTYTVLTDGIAATGYDALEDVVVSADDEAFVALTDVYGSFTVDVTAEGTLNDDPLTDVNQNTVDVTLTNTGVTAIAATGGDEFDYEIDPTTGDVTGLKDIDFTAVTVAGNNEDLTVIDVNGAATGVDLSGDLSSFTTLDLTGATNWFSVIASNAEFDPASGDYVTYLVGGTSSEFGGATADGGDSQITMADARETVTFTEADFGTVVLNGFVDGADPATGDRIDLSQLGFTNNGQLLFEEGTYDANGEFTVGGGNDVRISDLAGGPQMSGEIIITGIGDSDDLTQFNMVYA